MNNYIPYFKDCLIALDGKGNVVSFLFGLRNRNRQGYVSGGLTHVNLLCKVEISFPHSLHNLCRPHHPHWQDAGRIDWMRSFLHPGSREGGIPGAGGAWYDLHRKIADLRLREFGSAEDRTGALIYFPPYTVLSNNPQGFLWPSHWSQIWRTERPVRDLLISCRVENLGGVVVVVTE